MQHYKTILGIIFIFFLIVLSCGKDNTHIEEIEPPEALKNKKIILLIGDGMGLSQITAATVANSGFLNMERCRHIGLQKVFASDKLVPSSPSTTTAIACGVKTKYAYLGIDEQGNEVANLTEVLSPKGYSTGVVTTSFITDATPAAFFAHNPDRYAREEIALDLLGSGLDVVIGGGRDHFNARTDSLNLLDSLTVRGFQVYDNLETAMMTQDGKVACFTDVMEPPQISEGRGDMLLHGAELALRLLESNDKGFFLMVEGAQMDWAGHNHDVPYLLDEMLDFDRTVGRMMDYADRDGNTLVVILGDHETGGFALVGGDENSGVVSGRFIGSNHTATMIPVFAYGSGADKFSGVYENKALFTKLLSFFDVMDYSGNSR